MFRLIPRPVHRVLLRPAHYLRHRWRKWRKHDLHGCCAILRDNQDRTLLVMHSYGAREWCLPGGGVRRGENPEMAVRREIREEVRIELGKLVHVGALHDEISGCRHRTDIFTGTIDDAPRPDRREIAEARLFPSHSLPEPLGRPAKARLEFWREKMRERTAG